VFPSSREGGKTLTQLGPLEREWLKLALSEGPIWVVIFPPHLRTETDPVSQTSCFLVSRIPTMDILSVFIGPNTSKTGRIWSGIFFPSPNLSLPFLLCGTSAASGHSRCEEDVTTPLPGISSYHRAQSQLAFFAEAMKTSQFKRLRFLGILLSVLMKFMEQRVANYCNLQLKILISSHGFDILKVLLCWNTSYSRVLD
jgi:hypothetical protein